METTTLKLALAQRRCQQPHYVHNTTTDSLNTIAKARISEAHET